MRRAAKERFMCNVSVGARTDCWPWTAWVDKKGYGLCKFEGKTRRAHRVSWEIHRGPIPHGLCVLHHCDNPPCVNPRHLFLGTDLDNAVDRDRKGRRQPPHGHLNGNAVLTRAKVKKIRRLYSSKKATQVELAAQFGVWQGTISSIVRHDSWKNVP